jgi:hypothetical protein
MGRIAGSLTDKVCSKCLSVCDGIGAQRKHQSFQHRIIILGRGFESLPLRQRHEKSNKINRSLIVIGFSPPAWYIRVVHMTLSMTRPWKHPDSGYYWFRKRVPDDLRNLIGKREERFSLGTRDPSEAKRLHVLKLAEVEERWSNLRVGQRPLSPDDIARLAAEIGDQLRRQLETDPYQPLRWDVEIGASLWRASDIQGVYTDITQPLSPSDRKRLDQQNICYALVDERLSGRGVAAHPRTVNGWFARLLSRCSGLSRITKPTCSVSRMSVRTDGSLQNFGPRRHH